MSLDSPRDSKFSSKRESIIQEIYSTEAKYLQDLKYVQGEFIIPLSRVLGKTAQAHLFANIAEVISLASELDSLLKSESIGKAFLEILPYLKIYAIYSKNFSSALRTFQSLNDSNERFRSLVERGQQLNLMVKFRLNFQAYLLLPIQRIPRYNLLLKDLLNNTEEGDPDYTNLYNAVQQIEYIAVFVNETIRKHEMFVEMISIQKSLVGMKQVLLVPGRSLIKRGPLKKICRRSHQDRIFFLFTDTLIYASSGLTVDQYIFHRQIDLDDLKQVVVDAKNPLIFQLFSSEKSFAVYAESEQDAKCWVDAINSAKTENQNSIPVVRRSTEEYRAPLWIPDEEASCCMACNSAFSSFLIPRREAAPLPAKCCDSCIGTIIATNRFKVMSNQPERASIDGSRISMISSTASSVDFMYRAYSPDRNRNFRRLSNRISEMYMPSVSLLLLGRCSLCSDEFGVFKWKFACEKCDRVVCNGCLKKGCCDACYRNVDPECVHVVEKGAWSVLIE